MPWYPDDVWEKMKKEKAEKKGEKGKGGGKGGKGADSQTELLVQLLAALGSGGTGLEQQLQNALGMQSAGKGVDDDSVNWKGELQTAFQRSTKDNNAGAIKYSFVQEEGNAFKAQVTVGEKEFIGALVPGKKKAEQSAAKKALKALFKNHVVGGIAGMTAPAPKKGTKRKQAEPQQEQPLKCRLGNGIRLLLQRPTTKEDVVYKVEELGAGEFVGSVTVTGLGITFTGTAQKSKKAAENVATETAWESLKDQIELQEVAAKAAKKAKDDEWYERIKLKKEEAKLAKQAAKAAAEN